MVRIRKKLLLDPGSESRGQKSIGAQKRVFYGSESKSKVMGPDRDPPPELENVYKIIHNLFKC
jgi:hypothetical protein